MRMSDEARAVYVARRRVKRVRKETIRVARADKVRVRIAFGGSR